jgi:hypothetical protein
MCKFVGEAALFTNGCPVCGYSAGDAKSATVKAQNTIGQTAVNARTTGIAHNPFRLNSLPLWIYITTGLFFFISAIALFFTLR